MMRFRMIPALQVVSLTAVVVGGACALWPMAAPPTPQTPQLPAVTAMAPASRVDTAALAERIVDANIFSVTRSAPDERAMLGLAGELSPDAGMSEPVTMTPMDSLATSASDQVPALYGIIATPSGMRALLRLESTTRNARLYRAGESAGGYRVRSIEPDRVIVDHLSGSRVLSLSPRTASP